MFVTRKPIVATYSKHFHLEVRAADITESAERIRHHDGDSLWSADFGIQLVSIRERAGGQRRDACL